MDRISFIGVNALASPMLLRLLDAGFQITVHNKTKYQAEEALEKGAVWADTIEEGVKDAALILSAVTYADEAEELYFGEGGILETAPEGCTIIDMTTKSPELASRISYVFQNPEHQFATGSVLDEVMLGPLRVSKSYIPVVRELDNIRVKCNVMLMRAEDENTMGCIGSESGELLFRKYGVSGICVFNLSRIAQPGDELNIDFFDLGNHEWAADVIRNRARTAQKLLGRTPTCADVLRGFLLPRVVDAVLKPIGINPEDLCAPDDDEMVSALGTRLTFFSLEVAGIGDPNLCQVRRGGIDVACVSDRTMAVQGQPGLFAVGEALDVDGPCGGYNLHWAWSSGLLAGQCAARALIGTGDGDD